MVALETEIDMIVDAIGNTGIAAGAGLVDEMVIVLVLDIDTIRQIDAPRNTGIGLLEKRNG